MFNKLKTYDVKTKAGHFEIDEFRDFYIIKKKLEHPTQKGFYDPTAMVVAKKDPKLPFFPDRDFSRVFGQHLPFFFIQTGVRGRDGFLKTMRKASKDGEITIDEAVTIPILWREATRDLIPKMRFKREKKK
jgi:hypothetical protein